MEFTLTIGELAIIIGVVAAIVRSEYRGKQNEKDIARIESAIEKIVDAQGSKELTDQTIGTWRK